MDKTGLNLEIWVRMYEEQIRHVRHHESLRSLSTNIAVVVSAAVLGLFATGVTSHQQWALSMFLILLYVYGLMMSLKYYERSRLHHAVSTKYRDVISEFSQCDGHAINELRCHARREHKTIVRRLAIMIAWRDRSHDRAAASPTFQAPEWRRRHAPWHRRKRTI
ncbi:MAG: hypothetical protein OYH76_15420 [Defluviicoccus sp.]|nr:hypothetical protein [Defluviicoccus sp.]MDE0277283.1 hypothetical protein [Defluviicoccus sp.]